MPNNEFFGYTRSLEKNYESIKRGNPMVSIFCGDFNARSLLFWEGDTENKEGCIFNDLLMSNHLEQLINESTHIRNDGSQSCIDLHRPTIYVHRYWGFVIIRLSFETI